MLASESIRTNHYNESIFKQKLNTNEATNLNVNGASTTNGSTNGTTTNGNCNNVVNGSSTNGSILSPTDLKKNFNQTNGSIEMNGKSQQQQQSQQNDIVVNGNDVKEEKAFLPSHPEPGVESFLRTCVDEIIKSAVFNATDRSSKVVDWHHPKELKALLDLPLRMEGETNEKLMEYLKNTIKYSVKTGHPYFINQLYSGIDPYALVGQWLVDALNPSVYTYEVAPVFTLMEEEVLSEMRRIVGFPNNGEGDGIFCPGGSIANGYAISCARYMHAPETKQKGLFGAQRMFVFTSADAHYSIEKLATFMGFGSENVRKIPTNAVGKMDLAALKAAVEQCIRDGHKPLMVSATAGTTVLGAFDDLNGIADLCQQYNMWMHVDAAWGGGALVSHKHRHLLKGIERSDSVIWNPHKLLSASQQCSTFMTKHKHVLSQCHSTNATYLFQKDKFYDTSYDTGDKHIQCGRRADVFKFWFMWKAKGTKGLEQHIDQVFKMAQYFTEQLKKRPGFELVLPEPECTNISFWYVPPSIRDMERNQAFYDKLHMVAPKIKEGMIKKGSMMITYQPLGELPNFFRLVLQNSCLTEKDMQYFIDEIESLGNKL